MMQISMQTDQGFMAHLCMNQETLKRFTSLSPARICVTNLYSAERRRVERFIEQHFRTVYGAEITRHYPSLISVHDAEDTILAALGFRYAKEGPLFLEHYLDAPIEAMLSEAYGQDMPRGIIAETGNLVSSGQGASIFLFTALNAYLAKQGVQMNTVTATGFLSRYFRKLGFEEVVLAKADQSRLSDGGKSWGSYYQQNPKVVAGRIDQLLESLHNHLHMVLQDDERDMHALLHGENSPAELPRV